MRCSRCKCSGNLGTPDVIFHACIGEGSLTIVCECSCHATSQTTSKGATTDPEPRTIGPEETAL